jgi:perosamine synthetase
MFDDVIDFVRVLYGARGDIPLHQPIFIGNEKQYLNDCIDSTFVSSAGKYIDQFEEKIAQYVGVDYAVATSNGTSALHIALLLSGVNSGDEVITQPLTFVATCNVINYCGAEPIFIDVDQDSMGLSPESLQLFLEKNTLIKSQKCINKNTGKTISACMPMHTFGHPCKIDEIKQICDNFYIPLVEDAAESLGSFYKSKHTGSFGLLGALSFNGNKIITAGGGGCIITNDGELAKKARHLTTTAKEPHKWEYKHNMVGYNYRMPNLNAALLVAQLENLEMFLKNKRQTALAYKAFFSDKDYIFIKEPEDSKSNYWLNAIILKDQLQRDLFLEETNSKGIATRPIWSLMNKSDVFKNAQSDELKNAEWLEKRVVNIPSSVISW